MKNDDTFPDVGAPPTTFPERDADSDGHELASVNNVPKDISSPTPLPKLERRNKSHHRMRFLLIAMVVVVLVALAGGYGVFRAVSLSSRQANSAFQQVTPCPFRLGAGLVDAKSVRCGFLTVPEDWSQPQSPTIRLAVAVFKTSSPHPAPDPVLFLGGGPGQAVLETMGPTPLLNRDMILLDQRGTGYSQPSLRCLDNETPEACHSRLVKSGINLNAFTTLQNAADVHALIRALGYRQVNLDGVSYGTLLALTVMRLYPADLRSVVLNSVLPPQVHGFMSIPPAAARAFHVLFQGCASDSSCNMAYPHLQDVFYKLVAELNATPITFQATPPNGKPVNVHFTGNNLVMLMRQALYSTYIIPDLPRMIYQIRLHDYNLLASIYSDLINDTMSWGLYYSIVCGEDMAYTSQHDLEASVQGLAPAIRPALLDFGLGRFSICQFWGMKPVPAVQKEPVSSSIPTLILQGEYDPVTPPANGMLAAQTLSRSYFFLFPGVGHGVSSPTNCPNDIMNAFLENPLEKPDASCMSTMAEPTFT